MNPHMTFPSEVNAMLIKKNAKNPAMKRKARNKGMKIALVILDSWSKYESQIDLVYGLELYG